MKKITLKTEIEVYDHEEELPADYQQVLALAHKSLDHAYAPYSNFHVGAGVLLANCVLLSGSNQENAAYPVCICAERVALSTAASLHPNIAIKAIAVTAKSSRVKIEQPVSPCGTCRQFMSEVEDKHQQTFKIILQGESGAIYVVDSAKELLPLSFDASFL